MAAVEEVKNYLDHILSEVAKTQNIENFETNFSIEANYGDGFVAQFYTGDITNKNTGETIMVAIKKAPSWEVPCNPIFRTEDSLYSLIFPALNDLQKESGVSKPFDNLPNYFCGCVDPKKEYIAMENLKPLGYVMFDKMKCFDKEHLEFIFETYAKFHALSYVLRKKRNENYQRISTDLTDFSSVIQFIEKQMASAVCAAVNALDPKKDEIVYTEVHDLKTNVIKTFIDMCKYSGEHKCLIHGDCWSNNMLFKYSESGKLLDLKLIDFQLCQESSPIYDLSYFFYSGAAKKDMDDLDNYLQIYYKSFSEFATDLGATTDELFSFETLKSEWKENALFGVILGIYLWQIKLIPKEKITETVDSSKGQNLSMEEMKKNWKLLVDKVHESDMFKERTTSILRHAVKYGIKISSKIVKL